MSYSTCLLRVKYSSARAKHSRGALCNINIPLDSNCYSLTMNIIIFNLNVSVLDTFVQRIMIIRPQEAERAQNAIQWLYIH